jgi:hypothetical protein
VVFPAWSSCPRRVSTVSGEGYCLDFFFQPYSYWLSPSSLFTYWHWFELVFALFLALKWVFPFILSGCYSYYYFLYFYGGVCGFFVVKTMATKLETSLVNAPMTLVNLNGKNYIY